MAKSDQSSAVLGIDIGGSGIKGNLVQVDTGDLLGERFKVVTPKPATPDAIADVVAEVVEHFDYRGAVGCAFPGVVRSGVILSAANVDRTWIGVNAADLFGARLKLPVAVTNDADAAGIAEMRFGAGAGRDGVVILLTFGTGIGSALFHNGTLVPNTEFGHLQFERYDAAEHYASARVRDLEDLSWPQWGQRAGSFLRHLERVLSPDLFLIGGGLSRKWAKYRTELCADLRAEVLPAQMENQAGIVGAAMVAPR